jgi:hypothetical protein
MSYVDYTPASAASSPAKLFIHVGSEQSDKGRYNEFTCSDIGEMTRFALLRALKLDVNGFGPSLQDVLLTLCDVAVLKAVAGSTPLPNEEADFVWLEGTRTVAEIIGEERVSLPAFARVILPPLSTKKIMPDVLGSSNKGASAYGTKEGSCS